jgi:hypothetical protein
MLFLQPILLIPSKNPREVIQIDGIGNDEAMKLPGRLRSQPKEIP